MYLLFSVIGGALVGWGYGEVKNNASRTGLLLLAMGMGLWGLGLWLAILTN